MSAWTPTRRARCWPATPTSSKVESAANSAKDAGIDGVPTFILGGVAAVTGAQSPEVLANAIEQIAVNREQFLAEQRKAGTA